MQRRHHLNRGFTLVELIIVIVIIAILATLAIIGYNGLQTSARDKSLLSDLDTLDAAQTEYGLRTNTAGKAWYSPSGVDSDLNFTPSPGNIIDVVIGGSDYCMRAYNLKASKNSITNAYIKESSAGSCTATAASSIAMSAVVPTSWVQVVAGRQFTCGIANNLRAYCWGLNSAGQLGNNSTTNSLVPSPVNVSGVLANKTIKSISAGSDSVCVIASDDLPYCWGDNTYGELGNNSTSPSLVPVAVSVTGALSGKTIKEISVGFSHACVIASDNLGYCWGDNTYGELGTNNYTDSLVPVSVYTGGLLSGKTTKELTAANNRTCVIASDNLAYCWGGSNLGQLGNNATGSPYAYPIAVYTGGVLSGKSIATLSKGVDSHTCVAASDNKAYCFGSNTVGQVGNGTTSTAVPGAVAVTTTGPLSGKNIQYVSTGSNNSCALASDSYVYCWGDNQFGQLGNGNTGTDSTVPSTVTMSGALNGKIIVILSTGYNTTCVLASDYQLYCWGRNSSGEIGNNSTTDSNTPTKVNIP